MIIRPGALDLPTDPDRLFGRHAPLVLEVGFGDGHYLSHLAQEHPDWNLLGVEVSLGSVWRAWRRLKREDARHVRLMRGHARFLIRDVLPEGRLERVYVNFPDPWPRKRHAGNRLLNADFFRLLAGRFVEGGGVFLTTDHPEYFAFALDQARASGAFRTIEVPPPPATLTTKYARKWQGQQKPIFHAEFRLSRPRSGFLDRPAGSDLSAGSDRPTDTTHPDPTSRIIRKENMQHALLEGSLAGVGPFSKQVRSIDGGAAIVLDAFREMDGSGIMFRCIVEEPDLRQELLVFAGQKKDGVFVALQPFGDPLTTRGVKEAVRAVTDWLVSQGLVLTQAWI